MSEPWNDICLGTLLDSGPCWCPWYKRLPLTKSAFIQSSGSFLESSEQNHGLNTEENFIWE